MAELLSLFLLLAWGVVLGFGCHLFFLSEEASPGVLPMVARCVIGVLFTFFGTAFLLWGVSEEATGLYGFLCAVFGFWLYRRFLKEGGGLLGEKCLRFGRSIGRGFGFLGRATVSAASFPFGKIVDKGGSWLTSAEEKRKKRKENAKKEAPNVDTE